MSEPRVKVEATSSDLARPFANLIPILAALVDAGNRCVTDGFIGTPSGWECSVSQPIDFDLVGSLFDLPSSIEASPEWDLIHDRLSWSAIAGPGYPVAAADWVRAERDAGRTPPDPAVEARVRRIRDAVKIYGTDERLR